MPIPISPCLAAAFSPTYVQPGIPLALLALAVGIYRRSRRLAAAAAAGLFLWSLTPVAALFSYTLERRYPVRDFPESDGDAIVVLSGGSYKRHASVPEDLPKNDTYVRARYATWLHRNWKPLPVVVSGGPANEVVLAQVMRRVLLDGGVPDSMIWVEDRSRSTFENALYSAELLRARGIRRIVLVTQAYHMPRSERAFRRQGLTVIPAPCAFRHVEFTGEVGQWIPKAQAIERNEAALHEWAALLWYWLRGRT